MPGTLGGNWDPTPTRGCKTIRKSFYADSSSHLLLLRILKTLNISHRLSYHHLRSLCLHVRGHIVTFSLSPVPVTVVRESVALIRAPFGITVYTLLCFALYANLPADRGLNCSGHTHHLILISLLLLVFVSSSLLRHACGKKIFSTSVQGPAEVSSTRLVAGFHPHAAWLAWQRFLAVHLVSFQSTG